MADKSIIRITKEIEKLVKAVDSGAELSLAVSFDEKNVRDVCALIIGPPGTPYEFGFFEFSMRFGTKYPLQPPKVKMINHDGTRFGPNMYSDGKICLSILGTWHARHGEEWSPAQGLESVLTSIQSLMSSNPYENEPGYEAEKEGASPPCRRSFTLLTTHKGDASQVYDDPDDSDQPQPGSGLTRYHRECKAYAAKIRHETLRISVIQRMENLLGIHLVNENQASESETKKESRTGNETSQVKHQSKVSPESDDLQDAQEHEPFTKNSSSGGKADTEVNLGKDKPFADLCKRRFLWYFESYLQSIKEERKLHGRAIVDGTPFSRASFEGRGNEMEGSFCYSALEKRLVAVEETLDEETKSWIEAGRKAMIGGSPLTESLQRELKRVTAEYEKSDGLVVFELLEKNIFVWQMTIFGRPMTNLDGAEIEIKIIFSPRFPEEQPRVTVISPIFHHRVSATGHLCYFPDKPDSIQCHLSAIVKVIQDESPVYDPRTLVNLEACSLLWGSEDERRLYHRKLRRSVRCE